MSVTCPCGAAMVLRQSRFGPFWGCSRFPACKGSHGAHPDGRPLGVPADEATKRARIAAHQAFDEYWRGIRGMKRGTAYHWLQGQLGLSAEECHIGRFDAATCRRVIEACGKQQARE